MKQSGQESGGELCGICQILIVFAGKICKHCLQTAGDSGGLFALIPLPGLCPWTAPKSMGIALQMIIQGV